MKSAFVVVLLLATVAVKAAPGRAKYNAKDDKYLRFLPAVRHEEVRDEYGQYALRYIAAENTVISERGRLVPTKDGEYVLEIEGQYRYIGDDGNIYVTKYKGGPDGFRVYAKHLPQPVTPVPVK